MRARTASGFKGNLSPDLVERDGKRGEPKVEVAASRREATPGATRVRPIAGGRIANVVSKFRSGTELLSFSVTARRRGIQRESPSNLTNGQETGKIFQRKMFHDLTVFFRLVRRFLLDPVIRAVGFRTQCHRYVLKSLHDSVNTNENCVWSRCPQPDLALRCRP
jgi:hypothetical protein